MALSNTEKKEIENLVRKEIKSFMNAPTVKSFESKIIDKIKNDLKTGSLRGDINDYIRKAFTEFYGFMWNKRSSWESILKNIK